MIEFVRLFFFFLFFLSAFMTFGRYICVHGSKKDGTIIFKYYTRRLGCWGGS